MTWHFSLFLNDDERAARPFSGANAYTVLQRKSAGLAAAAFFLTTITLPALALAQSADDSTAFSRQGIFGCSRNVAALSTSIGNFSATGGTYVPVADYTVELNTGTLVYLECMLRGIVDRESESASTALIKQEIQFITTGNDGNALFPSNIEKEKDEEAIRVEVLSLQAIQGLDDAVTQATGGRLVSAVAKNFRNSREPLQQLQCPYQGDLTACRRGENLSDECKDAISDPRCDDDFAYWFRRDYALNNVAHALQNMEDCLNWGRGFYCVTTVNENGDRIIQTPSSVVEETAVQSLTSGFRRIENADNIDKMVSALYAGIGQYTVTSAGGLLTGLTSAIGNKPSYISQMVAESAAGLRNAAANLALQNLAPARQAEAQYNQVISSIANTLTATIGQLRSVENQCWDLIAYNTTAKHVCTAAPSGNTCTDSSGAAIRIATSTQFSQPIIDAQIKPLADQIVQNVQKSQQALKLIDQLITGVTNTSSLDAQRLALVQLDQLVARGALHVQADVTAAQQQQAAVSDAMSQLVDQTKKLWADDSDPTKGWCKVNNQSVIDMWDQRWR